MPRAARRPRKQHVLRAFAFAAVVFVTAATPAGAARNGLGVSPGWLELAAAGPPVTLVVINEGARQRTAQISVFEWVQPDGSHDRLVPTTDIRLFPKMVVLPPGERAVVRIVYAGEPLAPPAPDRAYQVRAEEVAVTATPGTVGLRFAITLPLFVLASPAGEHAPADPVWTTTEVRDGFLLASLENRGAGVARLHEPPRLRLEDAAGVELLRSEMEGESVCVLPGATRVFRSPLDAATCLAAEHAAVGARWRRVGAPEPDPRFSATASFDLSASPERCFPLGHSND